MAKPARSRKLSHIDAHWDHADKGRHYDISKGSTQALHVDIGHVDLGHVDLGHLDVHIDLHNDISHVEVVPPDDSHVDVTVPQAKFGHVDLGHLDVGHLDVGHLDFGHLDVFHIDVHVDITQPPDPKDPSPIETFVARVDSLITRTESRALGFDRERRQLAVQLRELRDQLTKALAKA